MTISTDWGGHIPHSPGFPPCGWCDTPPLPLDRTTEAAPPPLPLEITATDREDENL